MWFFISPSLRLCVIGSWNDIFLLTFFSCFIQLVFTVFNGEAWGYLGSRKFLQELDEGAASVDGISSLIIEQVRPDKLIHAMPAFFCLVSWYLLSAEFMSTSCNEYSFGKFTDSFKSVIYIFVLYHSQPHVRYLSSLWDIFRYWRLVLLARLYLRIIHRFMCMPKG